MNIASANRLEAAGKIAEALDLNVKIYLQYGMSNVLGRMAKINLQRLIVKISDSSKIEYVNKIIGNKENSFPVARHSPITKAIYPLVSIIVPSYNAERFLLDTIKSIEKQTYKNFECILVDDFSIDSSASIAKAQKDKDRRFRFYQHRSNGGLAASRNSGLRLAKGDYVCFLDADDILTSTSIEQRVSALDSHRDDACIAGVFDLSETIEESYKGVLSTKEAKYDRHYVDYLSANGDCPFNANQPMLRRDVLVAMGGFPEAYPQAEDWRLWSKILRAGYVFIPVKKIGSGYRQTAGSMIRRAPLLHLQKSSGNYFRHHKNIAIETDPIEIRYESLFEARAVFDREVGYYKALHGFLPRVFNFIGIEMGRSYDLCLLFDVDEIRNFVHDLVPSIDHVINGYSRANLWGWVLSGFKRYFGIKELNSRQSEFLEDLGQRFIDSLVAEKKQVSGVDKVILLDRIPQRAPLNTVDFLFFPHKEYHTKSFELLIPYLEKNGHSFAFVDISVPYRDENAFSESLRRYFVSYNEFVFSRLIPKVIVCMNDWDTVVKPLVRRANEFGIPTVGIVEGVQDYLDVDTGKNRNPYREVSDVFLPGDFDRKYFSGSEQNLWVTGVQRLDGLAEWANIRATRSPNTAKKKVVVNVNFSYGVMTDRRDNWLDDIDYACNQNGYEMIVSQHPQDDGDLSRYNVSDKRLYDLLSDCDIFVSRFSGAILEALVLNCPVVYYNGHQERLDKFHDSMGAYSIANNRDELSAIFSSGVIDDTKGRADFLGFHCAYNGDRNRSVALTVSTLQAVLGKSLATEDRLVAFKKSLGG